MKNKSAFIAMALSSVLSLGMIAGCAQQSSSADVSPSSTDAGDSTVAKEAVQTGVSKAIDVAKEAADNVKDGAPTADESEDTEKSDSLTDTMEFTDEAFDKATEKAKETIDQAKQQMTGDPVSSETSGTDTAK